MKDIFISCLFAYCRCSYLLINQGIYLPATKKQGISLSVYMVFVVRITDSVPSSFREESSNLNIRL